MAVLGCGAGAWAADALDELVKNSPFGSRATDSSPAGAAAAFELRGVFTDNGEVFFSIYEASSRTSRWVGLNETGDPFTVRRYDAAKGTVALEYQGREVSLELKQAKIQVMAPVAATPAPGARPTTGPGSATGPGAPPPGPGPQLGGDLPAEEAKRLAAIAEEIGRRRAQRQQMVRPQPGPQPVRTMPTPAPK